MRKTLFVAWLCILNSLISAQTVTGKVVNPKGEGLSGLVLKLYINHDVFNTVSDSNGTFIFSNITYIRNDNLPSDYIISNNFPNPFNPITRINFTLPKRSNIKIELFNTIGERVDEIIEKDLQAGNSFIDLELNGLSNGIYLAKITIDSKYTEVKKLVLLYGSQHLAASTNYFSAYLIKPTLDIQIDSIVVTGSDIQRKAFTNLPTISGDFLDLGNLIIELVQRIGTRSVLVKLPTNFNDPTKCSISSIRTPQKILSNENQFYLEVAEDSIPQIIFLLNQDNNLVGLGLAKITDEIVTIDEKSTAITIVYINTIMMGLPMIKAKDSLLAYISNLSEIEQIGNKINSTFPFGIALNTILDENTFSIIRGAAAKSLDYSTGSNLGSMILMKINSFYKRKNTNSIYDSINSKFDFTSKLENNDITNIASGLRVIPNEDDLISVSAKRNTDGSTSVTVKNNGKRHINFRTFSQQQLKDHGYKLGPGDPITSSLLGSYFDSVTPDSMTLSFTTDNWIYACGPGLGAYGANKNPADDGLFYWEPFSRTICSLACGAIGLIFSGIYDGAMIADKAPKLVSITYDWIEKISTSADVISKIDQPNPDYYGAVSSALWTLYEEPAVWKAYGDALDDNWDNELTENLANNVKIIQSFLDIATFLKDLIGLDEISAFIIISDNVTPPDLIPPEIEIIYSQKNVPINSLVNVSVHLKDESKLSNAYLYIDGKLYDFANLNSGATNDTTIDFIWNTNGLEKNSLHYLSVRAQDEKENSGNSKVVSVILIDSNSVNSCPGLPTITYEGKTYNTVQIGTQCWLKENLDIGTMINGNEEQTNNIAIEKYCYGDDEVNCTTYGGLYQWNEAMQYITTVKAKGICPNGWHIPTYSEVQKVITTVNNDGNALKAIGQGTGIGAGTDLCGFSALLSGSRNYDGTFSAKGETSYLWNSTESNIYGAYMLFLGYYDDHIGQYNSNENNGFSVRCLKDDNETTSLPCPGIPTVNYGGKIYNTVQIGEQCWLKENLNIGTMIDSLTYQTDNGIVEKYCYNDNPENCEIYGGLYQWDEAMGYDTTKKVKGICPDGWHIPDTSEFEILSDEVGDRIDNWRFSGSNALKETGQGIDAGVGTNTSGFQVLLAGYKHSLGYYYSLYKTTDYWNSSKYNNDHAYIVGVNYNSNTIFYDYSDYSMGFSVRCIKDFQASDNIPKSPILQIPLDNSIDINTSPTLSWSASDGANGYNLQISTTSNLSNIYYNQSGLATTSIQVNVLNNSTSYYWRVNAYNSYGTSEWSDIWTFSTLSNETNISPCPGIPTVTYSSKTYNTVQIGSQCWLKENLDVGEKINSNIIQSDNDIIEKYCYNNDTVYCSLFGGLYQWNEAMQYIKTDNKGICPDGWHIPTYQEFQTLAATVNGDGNALKEIGQGNFNGAGTNTSGFSALMAGFTSEDGTMFSVFGYFADFWSSRSYGDYLGLTHDSNEIIIWSTGLNHGLSVRCIKD